jgi:hypothetical protein
MTTKLDALIEQLIEQRLTAMLGDVETTISAAQRNGRNVSDVTDAARDRNADVYRRTVERIESKPTRTRRGVPSTAYASNWDRRKALPEWIGERTTTAAVFATIVASKTALTNAEIVKLTKLGKKTVESDVWRLRNHNAAGKRVNPGKSALVVSTAL